MSKQLVIYHGLCYDGFTAAWVCRQAMSEAELIPASYGQGVVDVEGVGATRRPVDLSCPAPVAGQFMGGTK